MKEDKNFKYEYVDIVNEVLTRAANEEAILIEEQNEDVNMSMSIDFTPVTSDVEDTKTGESWYFENVLNTREVLDAETQKELLYKYKTSTNEKERDFAFSELIQTNQRLVLFAAKSFKDNNVDLDDLIQEGNIGLIKAIEKYDLSLGCALSTYAMCWIKQSMMKYIQDTGSAVKMPTQMHEKIYKLRQAVIAMHKTKKTRPSEEDLAKYLNCSIEQIREIVRYSALMDSISLFTPIGPKNVLETEGYGELQDFIPSTEYAPEEEYRKVEISEIVLSEMERILNPRSFDIMCRRYGIGSYKIPETLESIGRDYGITKERVRQIQHQAEKRLSKSLRLKSLLI